MFVPTNVANVSDYRLLLSVFEQSHWGPILGPAEAPHHWKCEMAIDTVFAFMQITKNVIGKRHLTWRFLWNERPCPSQHRHLVRALIEMWWNGFARLTAGQQMEMSANNLMWPFSGDMQERRTWRPQVSDSLVCMTQDSRYKNNVSCLADVNVMMTSACSGERSGDRHWISDAEKVRQANGRR